MTAIFWGAGLACSHGGNQAVQPDSSISPTRPARCQSFAHTTKNLHKGRPPSARPPAVKPRGRSRASMGWSLPGSLPSKARGPRWAGAAAFFYG
ncbi:transposase [Nitrospirillum viridazoti Y2]|nr:transposase [Nitrospirillum amazonense Y2]